MRRFFPNNIRFIENIFLLDGESKWSVGSVLRNFVNYIVINGLSLIRWSGLVTGGSIGGVDSGKTLDISSKIDFVIDGNVD